MEKPSFKLPSVHDIQQITRRGPWPSKSGGHLDVLFGIEIDEIQNKFLHFEPSELARIPKDIRGLRSYMVSDIEAGRIGAREWHRIRNELVFVIEGSIKWVCEDAYGDTAELIINVSTGVWTPPFIFHTYEALGERNQIVVIASTLFYPEDAATHDTYFRDDFSKLQEVYRA